MKTFLKIFLFSLFSNFAYAYCDFEIINIGQSINMIPQKIKTGFVLSEENDQPILLPIKSEEICNDEKFEDILINYEFIVGDLQRIQLEDEIGLVDHLKNLKYYYGEPTAIIRRQNIYGHTLLLLET